MTERSSPDVVVPPEDRGPRVVAGIDFSPGARAALLFSLHDAHRRGAPVEAVAAYRPPDDWMDFYGLGSEHADEVRSATLDRLRAFTDEVRPDGPDPAPEVRLRAVLGSAADVLISESHGADLLVVGSRGHGGFASMLLGSVSMHCVLHATCPVTVVHSPEAHHERLHLHLRRGRSQPVRRQDASGG